MYYDICSGSQEVSLMTAGLPSPVVQMLKAIEKSHYCTLDKAVKKDEKGSSSFIISFYFSCDEIPSRNDFGIEYKEKIAFLFNPNKSIPDTLTLRKSFPKLMHQNSRSEGEARSLCLYAEDVKELSHSWTPEQHIERLKWWLVESAKGTLHQDSQAVEQLFFNPFATLLLESELNKNGFNNLGGKQIDVSLIVDRDLKKVFHLNLVEKDTTNVNTRANIVYLEVPPITHGIIYSPPYSLPELINTLEPLCQDFLSILRKKMLDIYCLKQYSKSVDNTIFIVRFFIRREDRGGVEETQDIAFFSFTSLFEMFEKLEIINKLTKANHPNIAQDGSLKPMINEMPDIRIWPMEIQVETTALDRRIQSGITTKNTNALLIGAGSVGASMLDVWTKQGWGSWTIIDDDILKPHNLTRYPLIFRRCDYKVNSIASSLNYIYRSKITPLVGIGDDIDNVEIKKAHSCAEFVVDATASLHYSRFASYVPWLKRHVSAFFNPKGTDAILLVEDAKRKTTLSSLEAQYYRAIINDSRLTNHLDSNKVSFSTGASCRDKSFIMSFSHTQSLSCLLADQIRKAMTQDKPQIKIWQNDFDSGNRYLINIDVYKSCRHKHHMNNVLDVIWDEGLEKKVKTLRESSLPNETGGILIGYYDFVNQKVLIVDALPQPADSVATPSSFTRGEDNVEEFLAEIQVKTHGVVKYIGEWHSHPKGYSATMSSDDKIQLQQLSERLSTIGYPAYQMIVADNEIKVYEQKK